MQIRNGSDTGWVNLYNFVMGNSMTNVANYNYVNNPSIPHQYRWKILRTRWDKTESVLKNKKQYIL